MISDKLIFFEKLQKQLFLLIMAFSKFDAFLSIFNLYELFLSIFHSKRNIFDISIK